MLGKEKKKQSVFQFPPPLINHSVVIFIYIVTKLMSSLHVKKKVIKKEGQERGSNFKFQCI